MEEILSRKRLVWAMIGPIHINWAEIERGPF